MSAAVQNAPWRSEFDVVVLVGSSGALPVLRTTLQRLPVTFPVPICVVQHQPATGTDYLARVLVRETSLPVRVIAPGDVLATPGVAVLPAGRSVTVDADRRFRVLPHVPEPGNRLLSALADVRCKVIAVILSGRLDDGACGVRAIRRARGRALVQEPETANAPGMPSAALATGCVDFALPEHRLAPALIALTTAPGAADLLRVPLPAWAS